MATNNQNLPARTFVPQYSRILNAVFTATKAFAGALAPLQILDGVAQSAKAFTVKTCNTPVVVGTYDTTSTVAFDSGTASSSRFGEMTEVIYSDTDVEYSYTLAIHEGLDRFTVNNNLNAAVADRLRLQSEAQTRKMNARNGKFMSDNAGKVTTLASLSDSDIVDLFNTLSTYYTDKEVNVPVTAYVTPDLFNAIIDAAITTTSKGSRVNVDKNTIEDFKGFKIVKEATKYFVEGDCAYFCPDGVLIPFVGINTARTMEAIDFDGVELQAAAKGGQFMLDDNLVALTRVTLAATTSIELNKSTTSIVKNATETLVATVTPSDTTDVTTWATSDATVATVEDGVVTGVAAGQCIITATSGAKSDTCIVTVTNS